MAEKVPPDLALEKGLPCNLDVERMVLGAILTRDPAATDIGGLDLDIEDFSLEKHRRIFRRMKEMHELGEAIDLGTLANELNRYHELESVDGLTYLTSLDDGLPRILNIGAHAKIIKEKSVLRQTIFRAQHLMNLCYAAETHPADLLSDATHELMALNTFTQPLASATPGGVVAAYKGGIDAFLAPPRGMSTGFAQLDDVIYGLQPETIYVVGADTSVGKSSLALQIAFQVSRAGVPVLYCSLEMSKEALVRRLISSEADVALHNIMGGTTKLFEMHTMKVAHENISDFPLYIDDDPYCSAIGFGKKIEQHIRQHKIQLAVFDYLQILDWQGKGSKFRDEREAFSFATKQFKQYAREFHIPVIEVSQLSRNRTTRSTKDLRPKLRDLHGCLPGDTMVAGPHGWKRIDTMGPGDVVFSVDEHQRIRRCSVQKRWSTGENPVRTVTTNTGKKLRATDNHPFLTSGGYRQFAELRPGDLVACPFHLPVHNANSEKLLDECRLIGYLVGDGSYTKHHHVGFTNADADCVADIVGIVSRLFPSVTVKCRYVGSWHEVEFVQVYDNGYGRPHGNDLREWLREVGVFGERDYQKKIPRFVFDSGSSAAAQFLAGYFLADGSVHCEKRGAWAVYSTTSSQLATETQRLLTHIGIASSINPTNKKKTHHHQLFQLVIARSEGNLRRFLEQVELVGNKAAIARKALKQADNKSTNPGLFALPYEASRRLAAASRSLPWRQRWYFERKVMRRSTLYAWAEKLDSQELRDWAASDLLWEEIVSIDPMSMCETFDIAVPAMGNFIANGFVVHNSSTIEKDADTVMLIYRPEMDDPGRGENIGRVELIVAKNRNGQLKTVHMKFEGQFTRFRETDPPENASDSAE